MTEICPANNSSMGIDTGPEAFPILRAATAKNLARATYFQNALDVVAAGLASASIRKAVLTDAKQALSRIVNDAYSHHVSHRFTHRGQWETLTEAQRELDASIMVMGLHDVHSLARKVEKTTVTGPIVEAMREFASEVLPLAQAVTGLKDKMVLGRAPSTGPTKPENPKKIVRTCACCVRPIAVTHATMAHHGYQRPGTGEQTASCPGIKFEPLERSSEGLAWMVQALHQQRASTEKALEGLPARQLLTELDRHQRKMIEFRPGDPGWRRAYERLKFKFETEIWAIGNDLKWREPLLRDWKQTEPSERAAPKPAPSPVAPAADAVTGEFVDDRPPDRERMV